jgi:hypothetical protein
MKFIWRETQYFVSSECRNIVRIVPCGKLCLRTLRDRDIRNLRPHHGHKPHREACRQQHDAACRPQPNTPPKKAHVLRRDPQRKPTLSRLR